MRRTKMTKTRVMMVGSARDSGGGVATVIRTMNKMSFWEEYNVFWLGTQIQGNYTKKLWYALKSYFLACIIIWRYDIVHFHTVPDVSMKIQFPVFLLALCGMKKIVLHLHVGNQLAMDRFTGDRLSHWCMRHSSVIVLLAHRFEYYIKKYWSDVKTPVHVIYNACDESVKGDSTEEHEKMILFVGRFTQNKAADILIRAFSLVHKKYPDWELTLMAEGPEQARCLELVEKLGIREKVNFPGFLYGESKQNKFQKAGIFCLCSFYEGFPMVILEAWAYGLPVVSTPVGGLPDVFEEGTNGFFYDYGNVETLAEKLDVLMGNPDLRSKMGTNNKQLVRDVFSKSAIDKQIKDLYQNLLQK